VADEGGDWATCSNGARIALDMELDALGRDETVLACGGIDVQAATTKRLVGWLRREARQGRAIAGLCTAAQTLADGMASGGADDVRIFEITRDYTMTDRAEAPAYCLVSGRIR